MRKILIIMLALFSIEIADAQILNYLFGTGWSKSDRLEYLLECRDGAEHLKGGKKRCDCNLAYLEKNYASLGWYHRHNYSWSEKFVDSYDNPERRKKLRAQQKRERDKMWEWVDDCLRGY